MATLYFEDLSLGQRFDTSGITVTESQVIDFAAMYDPQPIHLDRVAAENGPFGGLIASGWQTASLCFRMFMQQGHFEHSSLGGAGAEELRWLKPVRPGDTLRTSVEVTDLRRSSRVTDRGYVELAYTATDQTGEKVLFMRLRHLVATRPAAA